MELDTSTDGRFERSDDWPSVAYLSLDSAENGLPAPVAQRIAGP